MGSISAEDRVIARLNQHIGSNVENLHKSQQLVAEYEQRLLDIKSKITVDPLPQPSDRSRFQQTVAAIQTTHSAIELQITKIDQFKSRISERLATCDRHLSAIAEPRAGIDRLEHMREYLHVVDDINVLSDRLRTVNSSGGGVKEDQRLVELYTLLCDGTADSLVGRLENVDAGHLKSFASRTAVYWYNILVEKFSKDFETSLKAIRWPNMGNANEATFAPNEQQSLKLAMLAKHLYALRQPNDANANEYIAITPSILCPPLSVPMQLLLKPFRQRFQYHFSGAKQTNRLDKPEWFYTQILTWAKDNGAFVEETFQLAARRAGSKENVRLEFVRGLVQLVVEKLCLDIGDICADDHLFAHLLDETLSFEQELRETCRYPDTFPSALSVLTQAQYLMKWLTTEENFSTSQMDAMLTRGNPWVFIDPINLDELKIPKCADQFVRLLDAIKERYSVLRQPGHQLQFLNLQLELIDSFRRRLVQLHHSGDDDNVSSTKILNAINYLVSVLREWGENVHYLHLHVAHNGFAADDSDTGDEVRSVFESPIGEFEHWQRQIIDALAGKIVDDIKAKSRAYRHDQWVTMANVTATKTTATKDEFTLSATAGEMFQLMVSALHDLETELSVGIFRHVLRMIAARFDVFVIDGMLMNTRFSAGGAAQFQFDMTRNLFPLFGQYLARPHLLFKRIHDACILLTLPTGSALLLHETLRQRDCGLDEARKVLGECGVVTLTGRLALDILCRRTDMSV